MFFFSHLSFIWDQPAKIRQHSWKERLRITLRTPQSQGILQTFVLWGVGGKFVPLTIQTSVRFCDFVEQFLRSPWTYHL